MAGQPTSIFDIQRTAGHVMARNAHLIWDFLNSNFGTALVTAAAGAAAGAIAGALLAQMIAGRAETRSAQISEIRSTNAAALLAVGIVNSFIGQKRQFVLPMVHDLEETGERFTAWLAKVQSTPQPEPFEFRTVFRTFGPVQMPIEHLREILFNRIASDSFTLTVYQLLDQAIANSQDALARRNAMVEEFRTSGP